MIIIDIAVAVITVFICIMLFYYYMNWSRNQWISYDKSAIKELPKYVPPRWVRDAWDPTWAYLQRLYIKMSIYL